MKKWIIDSKIKTRIVVAGRERLPKASTKLLARPRALEIGFGAFSVSTLAIIDYCSAHL